MVTNTDHFLQIKKYDFIDMPSRKCYVCVFFDNRIWQVMIILVAKPVSISGMLTCF